MIQLSLSSKKLLLKRIGLCLLTLFISFNALAQPAISSFSPTSGPIGTTVTITGTNFSTTDADNIVFFGGIRTTVSAATATSLTVTVPAGAGYLPVTVTTNKLTAYSSRPFNVTFAGRTITPGTFRYTAHVDSIEGTETNAIVTADLDDDGRIDIAVVDRLSNTVSLYRNTSSGGIISFAARINYTTGNSPNNLNIGDLDGDGKPELIVANTGSNSVSVFKNISTPGSISFNSKSDFTTATQPSGIAINDIDGDGKPDLAISNINFSETISVLRNTTAGGIISFAPKLDYTLGGGSNNISFNDIDGDDKVDMVATSFAMSMIFVFRNTSVSGTVSFAAPVSFNTESLPNNFVVGDLDQDSKPDIIVPNFYKGTVSVFRNTSTGINISFSRTDYASGNSPGDAGISDIDGDGKPDLVVLNTYESFSVFKNISSAGAISFEPKVNIFSSSTSLRISLTDFDGDGKPDLSALTGVFRVLLLKNIVDAPYISSFTPTSAMPGTTVTITGNNFSGTTAVNFGSVPATSFTIISPAIINAVVGSGATGDISVTTTYGTDTLSGFTYLSPPIINSFTPTSAGTDTSVIIKGKYFTGATAVNFGGTASASFNVLSDTVIIAAAGAGSSGKVFVTTAYGADSLAGFIYIPPPAITSFTPASGNAGTTVTITGVNFTGATAVSFGNEAAASFTIISSTAITAIVGTGVSGNVNVVTPGGKASLAGFIYPPPVITSFTPQSGAVGTSVTITGTGYDTVPAGNLVYFGAVKVPVISAGPTSLIVSVPNGTTYQEITVTVGHLTAYSDKRFVTTFPGGDTITSSSFNKLFDTSSVNAAYKIAISDFDGDGKPDIGVVNGKMSIYRNTGSGNNVLFAPRINMVTGTAPVSAVPADIDGDGKQDIIVANYSSASFSLFRNNSNAPGLISFDPKIDFSAGSSSPCDILGADLDGDGRTDVALISQYPHLLSIYRNTTANSVISFEPRIDLSLGEWFVNRPASMCIGDIDGDAKPDIAVTDQKEGKIFIYRNTSVIGTVSFAPRIDIITNNPAYGISLGDLDGDGKAELVSVETGHVVSILKNTSTAGSVSFAPAVFLPTDFDPYDVAISDLDGDGKPDLAAPNYSSGTVSAFKNTGTTGTVSFGPKNSSNAGGGAIDLAIADFNEDGKPDIITANFLSNTFSFIKNTVDGPHIISFSPGTAPPGTAVTITGMNFMGVTSVNFGGVPAASFTILSPTIITAVVGEGASGSITVISSLGTTSITGFTYITPAPTITSFTPAIGTNGTSVTITGTNFNGATAVSFGGVAATSFAVNSSTTITAIVGAGTSGNVSVTTPGGVATQAGFSYNIATSVGGGFSNNNSKELTVSPNPANDIISVEYPSTLKTATIRLMDISGRTVKVISPGRNSNQISLSVKNIPAGIYKLIWTDGSRHLYKTLMIMK